MAKPTTQDGYSAAVTESCERVLVTLLHGLGPWKRSVYLVGGLVPRYLIPDRPPAAPAHAGTGDVDIVVTDGFAGNILLKSVQAAASYTVGLITQEVNRSYRARFGALWLRKSFNSANT